MERDQSFEIGEIKGRVELIFELVKGIPTLREEIGELRTKLDAETASIRDSLESLEEKVDELKVFVRNGGHSLDGRVTTLDKRVAILEAQISDREEGGDGGDLVKTLPIPRKFRDLFYTILTILLAIGVVASYLLH